MHLKDEQIRAWLDGELPAQTMALVKQHLETCPTCTQRAEELETAAAIAQKHIGQTITTGRFPEATSSGLTSLQNRRKEHEMKQIKFRPAFIAGAAVLALAISMIFPPVRALAGNFLGLFRIQQVQVLPIDAAQIMALSEDAEANEALIQEFFNANFSQVGSEGTHPAASINEAAEQAGFTPLFLTDEDVKSLEVSNAQTYGMVINSSQWNELFAVFGQTEPVFASDLDGQEIQIDIPKAIMATLAACDDENEWDCPLYIEIPSPSVTAPDGLDITRLAEASLKVLGVAPDEARHMAQTIDWASTLVLPIPVGEGVEVQEVNLNGITANLFTNEEYEYKTYSIIWPQDGRVIAITGTGGADAALDLVNSLLH